MHRVTSSVQDRTGQDRTGQDSCCAKQRGSESDLVCCVRAGFCPRPCVRVSVCPCVCVSVRLCVFAAHPLSIGPMICGDHLCAEDRLKEHWDEVRRVRQTGWRGGPWSTDGLLCLGLGLCCVVGVRRGCVRRTRRRCRRACCGCPCCPASDVKLYIR